MNEILLYGSIGESFWSPEDSITAKSVMNQLAEIDGDVTVRISSGGGDVYAGIDIMNALKNHEGEVTVIVESLAASAASFIAVGGADKVLMRNSSEMMIHRAWTFADGNADDVRKTLDDLERQDSKLAKIYAAKAGGEVGEWLDRMSDETWYTAEEAVDAGLADGLVDAKSSQPEVANAVRRRFRFQNRAAAPPPPPLARRSVSAAEITKKGDTVGIFDELAEKFGKSPGDVEKAFTRFFNESVQISGEVEVTYPEDVKVAPTEKVTVEPIIGEGDGTTGLTFEIGTVAEGFTAEVDEAGVLSITAPAGVEPGDKAEFSVKVNDVEVPVTVEVKAVSEESTEETTPEPTAEPIGDTVTLDRETYNEMQAAARFGWEAKNAADKQAREAEVDKWIAEGRVNPVRRAKIVDQMHADPEATRELYGKIPKNTIPLSEVGYSKHNKTVRDTADEKFDARAIAAARRKEGK